MTKPNAQQRPYAGSEMPDLEDGQERRYMVANPMEDTPEAVRRAGNQFKWAVAIVGKPWRVGKWWVFTIEAAKAVLPSPATAPR